MSSETDNVVNPSQKHQWLGVVEDFVSLKLEEHSYECILKHTDNLFVKLSRGYDVDEMVRKGVLPPLLALLGFHDQRDDAELQKKALLILKCILKQSAKKNYGVMLTQNGIFKCLLDLLKLGSDSLAEMILNVWEMVMTHREQINVLSSEPKCLGTLLEAAKYSKESVRLTALDLMESGFGTFVPPLDVLFLYVKELNDFLLDASPETVFLTIGVYCSIACESDKGISAMIASGCLPLMMGILGKGQGDERFIPSAFKVVQFAVMVASKGAEHVQQLVQVGILDCLGPYSQPNNEYPEQHNHASWVTAFIISLGDDETVAKVIANNLLPSLEILSLKEEEIEMVAFFQHLLQNGDFLKDYLDKYFLAFLQTLHSVGATSVLRDLLESFEEALRKVETAGKKAPVGVAMTSQGPMEKLLNLQNSFDLTVQTSAQRILHLCLSE